MSKAPSLAQLLESFFHHRLRSQRNASDETVASYRDALRLLVLFAADREGRKPCQLTVADLDRDAVLAFLDHLEQGRGNCVQTRNARLTAVRSFFHHVAASDPASLGIAQRVLAIPVKRSDTKATRYLSRVELSALIDAPDQQTSRGRRDRALLLFLARTGARISEALDADARDLQFTRPRQVLLHGKGRKQRIVPLAEDLSKALEALLHERGVDRHESRPIFVGVHGERLTRFGATHIVRRAAVAACKRLPQLSGKHISPHLLRHSLAMTLLQSGSDLLTIQAWLGHAQVATTHRYAAADVEMMRSALDKAGVSAKPGSRFRPGDAVLRLLERV
jgi:site-specific recombinase XerD